MELVDGEAAIWNVATATVPPEITLALSPSTMQVVALQETVLPAATAELPVETVTAVMSDEKLNDHSRAVGWAPPEDARVSGRAIVPPAVLVPEPMDRLMLWPTASS